MNNNTCYAFPKDTLGRFFIHELHAKLKTKKDDPFNFDAKKAELKPEVFQSGTNFQLNYEVFGWYPYWEDDYYKYINYSLLSTVSYVSYEVNDANGEAVSTHDWERTPMIDSAQKYGTKVLLSVTSFGIDKNHRLLKNEKAISRLISNLVDLLSKRNANGVCIDFEGISGNDKQLFTGFISKLNTAFKPRGYTICIALPNLDLDKSFEFDKLKLLVNRFVIMGYPYYCQTSAEAGPVAPLESGTLWAPTNLSSTVNYYLSNQLPASSLILALPYYGMLWNTEGEAIGSKAKSFRGFRTYNYIRESISNVRYDLVSNSPYSSYEINVTGRTVNRQCWFENDSSIAAKLTFIKSKHLAGMGIWALGYDKGYNDLWAVVASKLSGKNNLPSSGFTQDNSAGTSTIDKDTTQADGKTSSASTFPIGLKALAAKLQPVTEYRMLLLYVVIFISVFGMIGFLIAMFSANTRSYFFSDTALRYYYSTALLLFMIVALRGLELIKDNTILLGIGFVLGSCSYHLVTKIIEYKKRDIP